MYIEQLFIESFGSLENVSYELTKGVNIFRGRNESGKSTLAAFIKFIFYGLCGNTPDQHLSEKSRYTNWDHGISGGSLVVNQNGIRYRIERRVTPNDPEYVKVIDLVSGTAVFGGKCPGEVFFGVGEDIFSQTAFSAQGSGSVVDSETINASIDNILLSGNEALDVKGGLARLETAQNALLAKDRKSGKIYTMSCALEALENRIATAKENEAFLAERTKLLADNRRLLEENEKQLKKLEDAMTHHEAGLVLERFADLDAKKKTLDEARAKESAVIKRHTVNRFLPDEGYPTALKALHAEIGITEKEKEAVLRTRDAFAKTSLSVEQRTVLSRLEEDGGKEKALLKIDACEKKRKKHRSTSLVTFILALVCIAIGLLATLSELIPLPYLNFAAFGVAALLAAIALISLVRTPSLKELYRGYLAATREEADRHIDNALSAEAAIREENSHYAKLLDTLDAIKAKLAEQESAARALLAKWNQPYESVDSLLAAAERATLALRELKEAYVALQGATVAYDSAETALKDISRAQYQELFAKTAYVEVGTNLTPDMIKRNLAFCQKKRDALTSQIRKIELDIASRSALCENVAKLEDELSELKDRYNDSADRFKAYLMAQEAIRKASSAIRSRIAPTLSASASELMKASTAGKYSDIAIDPAMTMQIRAGEQNRDVAYMSAGTKALTYISLRLALIRLLFPSQMPPTVFDESFSWLDNTRLEAMMSLLHTYSQNAQVIVLTCCDREYDAVSDKSCVNLIEIK